MFKSLLLLSLVMILAIPVCVQAFPISGLMVANSMTFTTFTVTIVSGAAGMGAGAYSPDTITLANSNDSVIWHNIDTGIPHSATCGSGSPCGMWDTGQFTGSGFSATFGASSFALGTTGYYCKVHGYPAMYGGVIKTLTAVENWDKMSLAEREKASESNPIKSAFGLIFVPPNDSASTKAVSTNAVQQNKEDFKVTNAANSQVGMVQ